MDINKPVVQQQGVLSQIFVRVVSALCVVFVVWAVSAIFGE